MAGIFEKIRVAGLSGIHSLLDRVIDLNSVEAVKVHVRDLESALENLENGASEGAGYVRTLTREKTELEGRAKTLDHTIDVVLGDNDPNNDHIATAKQVELNGVNAQLSDISHDLEEAKVTSSKLDEAVSALRTKHVAMVEQIRRLESLQRSSKAKEQAAKSVKMVGDMVRAGDTVSVDNIMDRTRRQSDVADEKFDRAMGTLNAASGRDAAVAEANAMIEERKKRLAQKSA